MLPRHPNRLPFEGVLTTVDEPSDMAPSGSRGHCTVLTAEAAAEALPSLIGMGVGFKPAWDGHDARNKCGVITEAWLDASRLRVRGYVYGHDFPEVGAAIRSMDMGMSYEMIDCQVRNMCAHFWWLDRVTFSGAAILLRLKAAYSLSSIHIDEIAA